MPNEKLVVASSELLTSKVEPARLALEQVLNKDGASVAEVKALREALGKVTEECNDAIRYEFDTKYLATENPFREAILELTIPIFKPYEREDKKTHKISVVMEQNVLDFVNLLRLEAASKTPLAAHGQWHYWVEKLAFNVGARATKEIDGDLSKFEKAFKIDEVAKACDIGATPTSNSDLTKQLQKIVDGIIFEDNGNGENAIKVLTKDVKWLLLICCKEKRENRNVVMPRKDTMIRLVMKVINRILTDGTYEAE